MTQNAINNSASDFTVDNLFLDGNTISSTDTNGNIVWAPDGTGVISVTAAPIVPTTDRADSLGSASNSWDNVFADGLTFDDGTNILNTFIGATAFTPALEFGGASTGITYTAQSGFYMQIGNVVFLRLSILLSNKGSATGNAVITNIPLDATLQDTPIPLALSNTTFSGLPFADFNDISSSSAGIYQYTSGAARAAITDTSFTNSSLIVATGFFWRTT